MKTTQRSAREHNSAIKTAKHAAYGVLSDSNIPDEEKEQVFRTAIGASEVIDREAASLGLAGKPDLEALVRTVSANLAAKRPVQIMAPSCPDYKHDGSVYTFGGLGDDVSLLGTYQIEFAERFLPILDMHGIPYDLSVLTADIEIEDDFTLTVNNVRHEEALRRVRATISATGEYLEALITPQNGSKVRSAGFTDEFGDFSARQEQYEAHIKNAMENDAKFRKFVNEVHEGRSGLYERLYHRSSLSELLPRTIRTMAQYAALGDIARSRNAIITSHRTLNVPAYNNPKLALEKPCGTLIRVPVLNFDRRIY
ncbi:hypothetical protein HYV82_06470 [Candidatus Woesearchaeota archaeon]|nr:hypothetical protein [Candidatus Woesearchaeota archaeon]